MKAPEELFIYINFVYTGTMSRKQIYSIIKSFKEKQIQDARILLFSMINPPDIDEMNKQDLNDYLEENKQGLLDTCIIKNFTQIENEEDVLPDKDCQGINY